MKCRHCSNPADIAFVDLATSPPSNAFLTKAQIDAPESYFPLRVVVCPKCWLVQTEDYAGREQLFTSEYVYFSSFSRTWLDHCKRYAEAMTERFGLGADSMVCEIAANDGYLLQYFAAKHIPCYGFEPTASTAEAARAKGIDIVEEFFGVETAKAQVEVGRAADLTAANNVLAHVPDINDFAAGFATLLKPDGVSTFEFPHLFNLVKENQFDTIYHEHYSYLSLLSVSKIFDANGLNVFDVEQHPTHGGSLRVFAQRSDTGKRATTTAVTALLELETGAGLGAADYYRGFQAKSENIKNAFLRYLLDCKARGLKVAGYGAAAKGNTLMNFAGVRDDVISFVVDKNSSKQGLFTPGSRVPVVDEARLKSEKPDRVIIFPWNLKQEIVTDLAYVRDWGAKFVIFVPELEEI